MKYALIWLLIFVLTLALIALAVWGPRQCLHHPVFFAKAWECPK